MSNEAHGGLTPSTLHVYHIFLASPGDMNAERQTVRKFLEDYNRLSANARGLRFEVIDWENYSDAGVGRPQDLITQQTLDRFKPSLALVVGLMGQRFGSPSGTHDSGTEEEFAWAYQSYQERGWPEIKWFFRKVHKFEAPSDPDLLDGAVDQWKKVRAFRERVDAGKLLFVKEFENPDDFRDLLHNDLSLWLGGAERPWMQQIEHPQWDATSHPDRVKAVNNPPSVSFVDREVLLRRYLDYVINRNRHLQLQGIRSGGRLVHIDLEHIFITLKTIRTRTLDAEEAWLAEERRFAPGEAQKLQHAPHTETVTIKVEEALADHRHLVVLGDPGSGKTTLLRYLALCYARDRAEGSSLVRERLGLDENGFLPIFVPLRTLGAYLKAHHSIDDGTEGHARLLEFLRAHLQGERISIPEDFFDAELYSGRAVFLLDGMDEVGDFDLRRRVARLIEAFALQYARCRIVVSSRVVGYTGLARLGADFATTTIRDFSLADVKEFLSHWHRLIAIGQMGPGEAADHFAEDQTQQLLDAIEKNLRVRELAINPLMLTVIALVHRDRVKLPERRAELYAEAVDVLLGKWEEAKGAQESPILEDRVFDTGDRRLLLQSLALSMHEASQKEIDADALRQKLKSSFAGIVPDARAAERAVDRFLTVIQERTGLLVEAGQGVYRFSHLTFQEYLTAVEMAERDDYLSYLLARTGEPFWREAILLAAGYLSMKNRAKTTRLVQAIADSPTEPEPFHNLVLAAECIRDVGVSRVDASLVTSLPQRLQKELEKPLPRGQASWVTKLWGRVTGASEQRKILIQRRIAAATALSRIESGSFVTKSQYWLLPHGEPEWVIIPAGEFWMESNEDGDERPAHRLFVPEFRMAQVPVTNAQYVLYIQATDAEPLEHWMDGLPPKEKLFHPVTHISWEDAQQYCVWLSRATGKRIRLPSEAEWEKAARGDKDQRAYPWGNEFDATKCNTSESGLGDTSPVGIFLTGASPYGCLDMSGNVWEWTADWYDEKKTYRLLRGGSWDNPPQLARASNRGWSEPGTRYADVGFRCAQ